MQVNGTATIPSVTPPVHQHPQFTNSLAGRTAKTLTIKDVPYALTYAAGIGAGLCGTAYYVINNTCNSLKCDPTSGLGIAATVLGHVTTALLVFAGGHTALVKSTKVPSDGQLQPVQKSKTQSIEATDIV